MVGKFAWGVKAKHCWPLSTNFWKQKNCWHHPAMFCLITSSKLSRQQFEFSLKVKVMGSNPGYLLKYFLLYIQYWYSTTEVMLLCTMLSVQNSRGAKWSGILHSERFESDSGHPSRAHGFLPVIKLFRLWSFNFQTKTW